MYLRSINFSLQFLTISLNSEVFNNVKLLPSSNAYGKKIPLDSDTVVLI